MPDDIKEQTKAAVDQGKGKVQQAVGDLTDDDKTKAKGVVNEAKGKARQAKEDIKAKVKNAFRYTDDSSHR